MRPPAARPQRPVGFQYSLDGLRCPELGLVSRSASRSGWTRSTTEPQAIYTSRHVHAFLNFALIRSMSQPMRERLLGQQPLAGGRLFPVFLPRAPSPTKALLRCLKQSIGSPRQPLLMADGSAHLSRPARGAIRGTSLRGETTYANGAFANPPGVTHDPKRRRVRPAYPTEAP